MSEIRVQDDLYEYVNHDWIEKAVIPDDKPRIGGFSDLDKEVEELLIDEFNQYALHPENLNDENLKKAVDLFKLGKDVKRRNKEGIRPLLKDLKRIDKLTNVASLNRNMSRFVLEGMPLPFVIDVDTDMMDTSRHSLMMLGPSTILPDTTYYQEEMKEQHDALMGVWKEMVSKLLLRTNLSTEEQEKYILDAVSFDKIIASLVKSSEEWSEYTKMYNPFKTSKVASLMKPLKIKRLLETLFVTVPNEVIVCDPRFLKGFKTLFNDENFELYKHWAYIKTYLNSASLLSEKIREEGTTYLRYLQGLKVSPSIEKQSYHIASSYFSEPLGIYYGRKYFGEEAKKDVVEMVKEIIETYKNRVAKNDILSDDTKKKAILKLEKMVVKMGFPDVCNPRYASLSFEEGASLFQACQTLDAIERKYSLSKLYEPVDRGEWVMPGFMVNACYNPFTNDITFPAAILQAPFYSIKQTRSQNLGGIGAVIGHEISHAFDNNGANCDELGNLNNWWTKEDTKKFKAKTKAMIKQFDGIELPYGKVNGSLVVSENIADNGGMAVTLEIMSKMEQKNYEEYFYNWGKVWCLKARPEFLKLRLATDVHSPSVLRANMAPRNFNEWYETFDVKSKDKMFIAPSKRIIIW